MNSIRRMKSFASSAGKRQELKIVLPDIKMRPKEMLTISRVLSRCDPLAQVIFITLMENWSRAGFEVATTPQTVVLDAPCGEGTSPIAVLIEGDASRKSSRPAAIVLCWDKLRKQKQFPRDALDTYQNTVRGMPCA
jgi:DNA-binding LytR/AlgR family response regulator